MIDRKSSSWPLALFLLAIALFLYGDRSARTQFAQNSYAGVSAGSVNAQTITVQNIASYTDILSQPIHFTAGLILTNTAAMTLNANGLGAKNVYRVTPTNNLVPLSGGEVLGNTFVSVIYDGTQFQLLNNANPSPPGAIMDFGQASCPIGFIAATGQTVSQATYPALFVVYGTTWGPASGGNFTMPDLRNRTTYGIDANVGGFSSRITVAAGNFNGTVLGAAGAVQAVTLTTNQIPVITPSGSVSVSTPSGSVNITDPGHAHLPNPTNATVGTSLASFNSSVGVVVVPTGSTPLIGTQASATGISASFVGSAASGTFTGSAFNPSGGQAHPTLSPGVIINKCVRA